MKILILLSFLPVTFSIAFSQNLSGNNRWIDRHGGNNYVIEIKDEKWSGIISINADK